MSALSMTRIVNILVIIDLSDTLDGKDACFEKQASFMAGGEYLRGF